jgi:hypothetical protein
MALDSWTNALTTAVPVGAVAIAVVSAIVAMGRGKVKFGSLIVDFDRSATSEIRSRLEAVGVEAGFRQYALLREYHAQGLAQSRISFWFSLTFASIGFAVIALAVGIFLQGTPAGSGWLDSAGKPIFTLISGTVIDAVAALFFVQSNKARQLMTEFFDKLRTDRKLDESLKLTEAIADPAVSSSLKALLALHFAEVTLELPLFESVVSSQVGPKPSPSVSLVQNS